MTFERFSAVVKNWQARLTPEQARSATGRILAMGIVDDLPCGISVDAALAMVARGEPAPVRGEEAKSNGAGKAPQPVSKRARALLRQQLKHGPRPGAQIEAAAKAAAIPESALIAAATELGVRTRKGQWWLPG